MAALLLLEAEEATGELAEALTQAAVELAVVVATRTGTASPRRDSVETVTVEVVMEGADTTTIRTMGEAVVATHLTETNNRAVLALPRGPILVSDKRYIFG